MIDNNKDNIFSAEIIDTALPNGWAVVKHQGKIYFLQGGVVGDTVTVKEIKKTKNFSYGEIIKTDKKSAHRIQPLCPHSDKCSGCIFQNLNYDTQIDIKQNYVTKTLKKFAHINQPATIHKADDFFYYRNKIELSVSFENDQILIGYKERLSPLKKFTDKITPVNSCIIFTESLPEIINISKQWIKHNLAELLDEKTNRLTISKLGIKESKNTSEILIYLIITGSKNLPNTEQLYSEFKDKFAKLSGLCVLKRDYDSHKPDELIESHGNSCITEQIETLNFRVYPQTFFQPNTKMALKIYKEIAKKISSDDKILSLYCGSGVMEIFLSGYARQVTGIDVNKLNIQTANENLKDNNIKNCTFKKKFAEDVLIKNAHKKYDKIIIDPPRNGLTKNAAHIIGNANVAEILYLSCSPPTLARDLTILQQHNYQVKTIDIFDQFPQTAHVETLVWLEKK